MFGKMMRGVVKAAGDAAKNAAKNAPSRPVSPVSGKKPGGKPLAGPVSPANPGGAVAFKKGGSATARGQGAVMKKKRAPKMC